MAENIAAALGIPADRVSVKATTEEGLGFTGSGEGISAQAITLLTTVGITVMMIKSWTAAVRAVVVAAAGNN